MMLISKVDRSIAPEHSPLSSLSYLTQNCALVWNRILPKAHCNVTFWKNESQQVWVWSNDLKDHQPLKWVAKSWSDFWPEVLNRVFPKDQSSAGALPAKLSLSKTHLGWGFSVLLPCLVLTRSLIHGRSAMYDVRTAWATV